MVIIYKNNLKLHHECHVRYLINNKEKKLFNDNEYKSKLSFVYKFRSVTITWADIKYILQGIILNKQKSIIYFELLVIAGVFKE